MLQRPLSAMPLAEDRRTIGRIVGDPYKACCDSRGRQPPYEWPVNRSELWAPCALACVRVLVFRRPLDVIDHEGPDRASCAHQLQPQLFAHRRQKHRSLQFGC